MTALHGVGSAPLLIAHRGASGHRPEHTRGAYVAAARMGADAVEPDLVPSRDGVLVVRHENELSRTTDVAERTEFAARRTTKTIEGAAVTGWFTEDFSWAELATLRARERLPALRRANTDGDRAEGLLSFPQLLELVDDLGGRRGRPLAVTAELKHPQYFRGLGLDTVAMYVRDLSAAGWADRPDRLATETTAVAALHDVRRGGVAGDLVFLLDDSDDGRARAVVADDLLRLRGEVDAVSVHKSVLLDPRGGVESAFTDRAHAMGLAVYVWTLRPENVFLSARYRIPPGDPARFGRWSDEWRDIVAGGVDAVFTDYPDLARGVIAA